MSVGYWLVQEHFCGDPTVGIEDGWCERRAELNDDFAYCSACGKYAGYTGDGTIALSPYCPNCGQKMDISEADNQSPFDNE